MESRLPDSKIVITNVMTGGDSKQRYLYYQLMDSLSKAKDVDLIVSFLMESGVRMILDGLKSVLDRGGRVRILTGNYLGITQPSALYLIRSKLGYDVDLHFYDESNRSFHPKSYIFHYKDHSEIFIGSSNISRSALTSGIEWNFRFSSIADPEDYQKFYKTFEDLFENHSIVIDDDELKRYSKFWHKPAVYKDLDRYEDTAENGRETGKVTPMYRPRGAQIEALYALNECRAQGAKRALVHAATGVGKTYLAAFDSQFYPRVLFVAHRQEIIKQAAESFRNVRNNADIGFFWADRKDIDTDLIFAMVESLGKSEYLNEKYFSPDYFDYIVIDEFHHAVTKQYKKIIEYFHPKFLLGLTATPDRMDGSDIYVLCDYNVPFELNLRDAINKGMLVPFHYYGIYDETDYSGLHIVRGHYTEQDLNRIYIGNQKRYDLIYKYYLKYPSKQALGFCSTRTHAEDMAREFNKRGIKAAAVYSGEQGQYSMSRNEALQKLRKGQINVIFSVDMFNEGVDVPSLDMVMFLRPTDSPVVFLQQLGRGLRKYRGKEYLNVLDFIGNYKRAGDAPKLLSGDGRVHGSPDGSRQTKNLYPDDCIVDFDMRLIDLFKKMQQRAAGVKERIDQEIIRINDQLGHVPSRMELFTYMDDTVYALCMANPSKNPFRTYMDYLKKKNWLSMEEQKIYDGIGKEFLDLISTTSMTKVYKMPVLQAFITDEGMRTEVTGDQVVDSWKRFFSIGYRWKDLLSGKGNKKADSVRGADAYSRYLKITDSQHLNTIYKNPINFLIKSGKGFFVEKEGFAIAVKAELKTVFQSPVFRQHYKDIIDYRTIDYYRRRYVEGQDDEVFLFDKKVDKSLLKNGLAIPKDSIDKLLKETGITLKRGERKVINAELDGQIYQVTITSLDFSEKYKDQTRVQIRYTTNSEIGLRLNELYSAEDVEAGNKKIKVYAAGRGLLIFKRN